MNQYLLLRDNHQRGPYSLSELSSLDLQPTDLIWIQGKSNGWAYAGQTEELRSFFEGKEDNLHNEVFSPGTGHFSSKQNSFDRSGTDGLNNKYVRPPEFKQPFYQNTEKTHRPKKYKTAVLISAVPILILGVFLVKKMFDRPEEVQVKVSALPTPPAGEPVTNAENFQNALSKEFIPYEAKPKKAKPKDLKKLIAVEPNDYHSRLLGGINDLELTVQNYSEHLLDKVVIKVDYLKPKGEIINSEVVTVTNLKSQESKVIEVPPSSRGVKIKYTILNVQSHEYDNGLKEI